MKPTFCSLLAKIGAMGGTIEVVQVAGGRYNLALFMPSEPVAVWSVPFQGDDEQLRAILQSCLRSISRSPERL